MDSDAGKIDSSGFRLTYTSKLRANDLGVLALGASGSLMIPPGNPAFDSDVSVCPAECTLKFPKDLVVVGNVYHMHSLGRKISTRIIRGGAEVPYVKKDFYDYNYQGSIPAHPQTTTIKRGDALLTKCTFDSTSRTNVTKTGEATQDEVRTFRMASSSVFLFSLTYSYVFLIRCISSPLPTQMCFNFILYYPSYPLITACIGLAPSGYSLCANATVGKRLEAAVTDPALGMQLLAQEIKAGYVCLLFFLID
jgi:hypothetical protein